MRDDVTTHPTCRLCKTGPLARVVDLGEHYLSTFRRPGAPRGDRYPLVLMRCTRCHLVQLRETVSPDALYRHYSYRSGINESMRAALAEIAQTAERIVALDVGDMVLDIGGNDGTLLLSYATRELVRVNCDPSDVARECPPTICVQPDYFRAELFAGEKAKIITAIAMVYDLDDPHTFLGDVAKVLDPQGVFIVQMSHLGAMLESAAYDVICHEHLLTWSTETFAAACLTHGLVVRSVEHNAVNGGSARYYVTHAAADNLLTPGQRLSAVPREERIGQLHTFGAQAELHRDWLLGMLYRLKSQGKTVAGLGASTKANTVYQFCGITTELVPYLVDRDPHKRGLLTPTDIPIVGEEAGGAVPAPDVYLVNIWQFLPMLKERHEHFLAAGGQFLVPFPIPHLEGAA